MSEQRTAYAHLTIIDSNDIESIIVEYNRNQSTTTPPAQNDSGWSTNRPAWSEGYYIWQRVRIHKSGTQSNQDSFGTAVCLTGSTGATGKGIVNVETLYATNNSTSTAPTSGWQAQPPTYNSSKPKYWVKITTTYSSGNPDVVTYLDNGITDAIAKAAAADTKAEAASTNATNALNIATGINQHFWTIATDYATGIPAGSYITNTAIDTFKSQKTGGNLLTRSDGIYIRDGVNILASLTSSSLIFNNPSSHVKEIELDQSGLKFYDSTGQNIQAIFGGTQATVSGTINAYDGKIGGFIIDETSIHNKMESFDDEILIPHKEGDVLIISDIDGDYLVDDYELGANNYLEGDIEVDDFSGVYMGTDGIALGKGVFKINKYGSLYATNATIEGDITATSGKFGVETGYYEVDEHGLIGYVIGENGKAATGTELGYDYLMTDKIIASDGMRVMDENDTFVSFERTSSIFGIDGQSRFFISATGLNFVNGREQSLFSVAQDQVERIEKTAAVVSFSTNTDVDELTRFISDIDVVEEITPYAELKINNNNNTRYRPYTLINCVVTAESGVNVTINSDAVDDIISKMLYTYTYEYYDITNDDVIIDGKNYYDSNENLIDPSDYIDSESGELKNPNEEGWLEFKTEQRAGYYSCEINVIYTANIILSSIVKIKGNVEVISQGNPIRIFNNEWSSSEGGNTDTMLRTTNTVTGVEVGFGVGSSGQNHGVWSEKLKNWIIYCDENNRVQIPTKLFGSNGEFSRIDVINNSGAAVHATCNNVSVALHTSTSGNKGVYDAYRGNWIIYSPNGGGAYIPAALNVTGSIWATAGGEAQIGVKSGAGRLYIYSQAGTNGNRGLYGSNASGTSQSILFIQQSGAVYIPQTTTIASTWVLNSSYIGTGSITPTTTGTSIGKGTINLSRTGGNAYYTARSGSYSVSLVATTGGDRGVYNDTTGYYVIRQDTSGNTHIPRPLYVENGDIYNNTGALHLGTAYSSALHVSCVWSDSKWHDIITRNASENSVYIGGANSLGITTNTYIRGSNVKLQGSSGATISSDRNIKKDISEYDSKYDDFYDALNPITYKYIHGTSGRTHCGFISQDVRDALISSGLSTSDFGGYIFDKLTSREIDSDGTSFEKSDTNYLLDHGIDEIHQLIYSEFISLNTWQIQKLKKRVSELEKELEELKKLFNKRDL